MDNFRNLIVWKRAVELATSVYRKTVNFPKYELYGLTSQIRRSAVSISSNIAEGAGRRSKKEFANFLGISYGSACELETQLLIARNLEYLVPTDFDSLFEELNEIQKMLYALEKKQRNQTQSHPHDSRLKTQD
ncbi:MAG: four helix bundle protein [Balneolaceae bacterium]|nr:four helix bundle protein [Balneolaceae bacterium]MCH8548747.1 four helix bundle protein [Balneolaceae bacterium]